MVHETQQCEHPAILLWTKSRFEDTDRPSTGTCPRPKTEDQDRRPQGFTPRPAKTQDRAGSVWPRPKTTGLHLPKTEDRRPRSGADRHGDGCFLHGGATTAGYVAKFSPFILRILASS